MRSLIFLFLICFTFIQINLSAQRIADPGEIIDIYFHIYKFLGKTEGYVVFYDREGNQCSTYGCLTLWRKYIIYKKEERVINIPGKPYYKHITKTVPKEEERIIKKVFFKPEDFRVLKLRSGDEIYALPITLPPNRVTDGDIVILKWRHFRRERKIYGW